MAEKEVALGLQKLTSIFSLEILLSHHPPCPCFCSILPLSVPSGLDVCLDYSTQQPVTTAVQIMQFYKDWNMRADHFRASSSCFSFFLGICNKKNLTDGKLCFNIAMNVF